jgi:hypothetical protein
MAAAVFASGVALVGLFVGLRGAAVADLGLWVGGADSVALFGNARWWASVKMGGRNFAFFEKRCIWLHLVASPLGWLAGM